MLAGYRLRPAADFSAIYKTLIQVSQLICDIPEVVELDINPLLADEQGVVALDARLRVTRPESSGSQRLAIRPYPRELEEEVTFDGRKLVLRPIRPEDEPAHRVFFTKLSEVDIRFRFFGLLREPAHIYLARYTQIDYEREMAFIVTRNDAEHKPQTLGVARVVTDPDNITAEFGIVVRSDLKGKGLGSLLLKKLVDYCRARGTAQIIGHVLADNARMLALAEKFGFRQESTPEQGEVQVSLSLT